jgi:DNA-binding transcriptional LysR family regulator
MVDLLLYRSFLAVARHGAVTEAAAALGLTQPALSRRIRQLEDDLGAPLFERSRKGVALTEIGRLVRREAEELVARHERLRKDIGAHLRLEVGTVRVGGGATAVSFLVPDAIRGLARAHPGVRFQVKEAGSREIEDDVRHERLELGIVTRAGGRPDELEVEPLLDDEIVLVAPATHPLARARKLGAAALAGENLVGFEAGSAIRQLVDAALAAAGVEMNVVMELRSIPAILHMAVTTGTLAFVSRLGLPRGERTIRAVAVRGLAIRRELVLVRKRARPLSPAAAAFAALLRRG